MTEDQALKVCIDLLKSRGYRVSKPRTKIATKVDRLNAIGRPYSPQFDPNYRMKHHVSTAHLFKPYGTVSEHMTSWSS